MPPTHSPYPASFKAKVIQAAAKNGAKSAGKEFGVRMTTVYQWCRVANVTPHVSPRFHPAPDASPPPDEPRRPRRTRPFTAAEKANMMGAAGKIGVEAAARKYHVSRATLYAWLRAEARGYIDVRAPKKQSRPAPPPLPPVQHVALGEMVTVEHAISSLAAQIEACQARMAQLDTLRKYAPGETIYLPNEWGPEAPTHVRNGVQLMTIADVISSHPDTELPEKKEE